MTAFSDAGSTSRKDESCIEFIKASSPNAGHRYAVIECKIRYINGMNTAAADFMLLFTEPGVDS